MQNSVNNFAPAVRESRTDPKSAICVCNGSLYNLRYLRSMIKIHSKESLVTHDRETTISCTKAFDGGTSNIEYIELI